MENYKQKYEQAMVDWSADAIRKTKVIVSLEKEINQLKDKIKKNDELKNIAIDLHIKQTIDSDALRRYEET